MVNAKSIPPARRVIGKFGGLANMARALAYPKTTVQRWWTSGTIRSRHYPAILKAALDNRVRLAVGDFIDIDVRHEAFRPVKSRSDRGSNLTAG